MVRGMMTMPHRGCRMRGRKKHVAAYADTQYSERRRVHHSADMYDSVTLVILDIRVLDDCGPPGNFSFGEIGMLFRRSAPLVDEKHGQF